MQFNIADEFGFAQHLSCPIYHRGQPVTLKPSREPIFRAKVRDHSPDE
ncbi:MAG TPA: hypothetical protein VIO94_10655 [Phenylobacterium sp.]